MLTLIDSSPFARPMPPAPKTQEDLEKRALEAYPDTELMPDNSRNRREWIRAVAVVRSTANGWHLDKQAERRPRPY
jgi:hypothetical protein